MQYTGSWDTMFHKWSERGKKMKKIKALSIRESVFLKLRELILNHELKPKERLSEAELAESLGVSRTPVREALHKLELEGLVKIYPRRFCKVIGITKENIHEINLIRLQLEPIVSRDAVNHLTDQQLEHMKEMIEKTEYYFETMNVDKIMEANDEFHSTIIQASKYQRIIALLNNLHDYIVTFRHSYMSREKIIQRTIDEHKEIYAAFLARDEDKVESLSTKHLSGILEYENVVLEDM